MVVGAGAAFSDQSKIKNTEAVDACTALNIIGGYPDGSFKPEGNITRAEVTKMICVALNGGKEPNLATNATPTFSDVRTNANSAWAEKYIESCASQGIVSGVGAGKFAPAGNVTGTQLAKMLLVALGYKSENEGFTGNAWATNVNTIASAKGLYKDLETIDPAAALTRDSAAQMIWNALQAYEVEYKTTLVTDSKGQLTSQITVQDKVVGDNYDKITLLKDKYEAYVNIGTLVSIDGKDLTITMSNSDRAESDTKDTDFTKLATDYSSLLGQKVKVIFKNGKANDVLGVYATGDNTIYKALMNDVELDGSKVKFDGKSYSVDNTSKIKTIVVGLDGTTISDKAISYFDSTARDNAGKLSLNEVTFVDTDDNGKIDTAIVIEKVAAEVTNVASDKITFNGKTYKYADEQIDKNIAQDDWAVMSVDLYKDCKTIVKANVVTAVVDGYKAKTNYYQYKIDGTWYNVSKTVKDDASISTGDTVKAYVYNGVAVKLDMDDGNGSFPSNIAVAVGVGGSNSLNGDQVRVRYFDGTLKTLTMSDKSETPTQGVAYKITGSDDNAKLEKLVGAKEYNGYKAVTTGEVYTIKDNQTTTQVANKVTADPTNSKIGETKVDDNAVIILYTETGRSKIITGKQFNALKTSDPGLGNKESYAVFTKKSNGLNRVQMAAINVSKIDVSGNASDNYAYIVSDGYENNGDVYYTIWDGAKNVDVIEENASASDRTKGTLIGYSSIDSNKKISDVTDYGTIDKDSQQSTTQTVATTTTVTSSTKVDKDHLYRGGNESTDTKTIAIDGMKFNITADTTVLRVDSDADKDADIGQAYTYGTTTMTKAQKDTNGNYTYNVFFVMDEAASKAGEDDLDLAVLVIDTTGAFKGHKINDTNNNTNSSIKDSASAGITVTTEMTGALKAGSTSEELTLTATVSNMMGYTPALTITDADGADVTAKFTVTGLSQIATDNKTMITPVVKVNNATAGKYVLTLTVGSEKVVRNFTVAAAQ